MLCFSSSLVGCFVFVAVDATLFSSNVGIYSASPKPSIYYYYYYAMIAIHSFAYYIQSILFVKKWRRRRRRQNRKTTTTKKKLKSAFIDQYVVIICDIESSARSLWTFLLLLLHLQERKKIICLLVFISCWSTECVWFNLMLFYELCSAHDVFFLSFFNSGLNFMIRVNGHNVPVLSMIINNLFFLKNSTKKKCKKTVVWNNWISYWSCLNLEQPYVSYEVVFLFYSRLIKSLEC